MSETGASRDKLKLLREAFMQQIPAKLQAVDELWREISRQWDEEGAESLFRQIHTLAGSAPSFGFTTLGDAAREAERHFKTLREKNAPPEAGERREMDRLMEHLGQSFSPDKGEQSIEALTEQSLMSAAELPPRKGKLVYIADDDPMLLKKLSLQISYFGYGVKTFDNLAALGAAVRTQAPSVIIMDMMFPEGEAAGAHMAVRIERELGYHLPVLFMSRKSSLEMRLEAVKAGGDAYFLKPVHISTLIEKLDGLTDEEAEEPYRILIVDDDPELSALYALTLGDYGMETRVLNDPKSILKVLAGFNPDLILMDMYMPDCDGYGLARVIRQMEAYVSIPIVFLSSETNLEKQLKALRMGGDDFLTKPIQPDHLISSVSTRAQRMRIIRTFMEKDSLTGLLNHSKSEEQLELAVLRARRSKGVASFAMIDIDNFKNVNDTYGHQTGDRVLVVLSRLLQQRLRRTDVVGRYGGEEFAVVLPDTPLAEAAKVLEDIRAAFEKIRHEFDLGEFKVTFSCGVADFPTHADSVSLNKAADDALYRAKKEGRNRVITAS